MISVAMSTYNGEKFLEEQLDSLSKQTRLPEELIVCDDQSADRTLDILHRYARNAAFEVRLLVNERRLGYRANFMKAASLCRGELIAFCDQDDIWLKDKLATVDRYLSGSESVFLQHGLRLVDAGGRAISGDLDCSGLVETAPWSSSLGLTQAFNRSLLIYSPLWDLSIDIYNSNEKMGHDQWISFIGQLLGDAVTVPDVLVLYRQHGQNTFGFTPYGRPRTRNLEHELRFSMQRLLGDRRLYNVKRSHLMGIINRYAASANSRMAVIEAMLPTLPQERRRKLLENLAYYRRAARYHADRLSIYSSNSRIERFQRLSSLYLDRSYPYWKRRGVKDSFLDFLYGVAN